MSRKATNKQQGFTIIELLIATIVFSVLLIVMLAAFIRTGDLFYKGVSMSKTQEDARNIVQTIGDDIQFTNQPPTKISADINTDPTDVFCIGQHRYRYQIGQQVGQTGVYGLAYDTVGSSGNCPPIGSSTGQQPVNQTNDVQMLDGGMQLNHLLVDCTSGPTGVCHIEAYVVFYGQSDTLQSADEFFSSTSGTATHPSQAPDAECKGALNDTDLCATVDYSSTVLEEGS